MLYVENGPRGNLPEPGSLYVYVYVYVMERPSVCFGPLPHVTLSAQRVAPVCE